MIFIGDDVTDIFVGTAASSTPGQGVPGVTTDETYIPGVSVSLLDYPCSHLLLVIDR